MALHPLSAALGATKMIKYFQVKPNSEPPLVVGLKPFRAVIISEDSVLVDWQETICDWLVSSGCLYMSAWGVDCSSWDDAVDNSNIKKFGLKEIPEKELVITTWHDKVPLTEAFYFAKYNATHPVANIENTLLIHVSKTNKEQELLNEYART